MIGSLTNWLNQHTVLVGALATSSVLLLLVSILAIPPLIAQLPNDYLLQRDHSRPKSRPYTMILTPVRTTIGLALILLGLVMLVLPGPGLVTLLLGLSMASFPGKRRLLRHIASREAVFTSLNWMRNRYDKPPLLHPFHDDP